MSQMPTYSFLAIKNYNTTKIRSKIFDYLLFSVLRSSEAVLSEKKWNLTTWIFHKIELCQYKHRRWESTILCVSLFIAFDKDKKTILTLLKPWRMKIEEVSWIVLVYSRFFLKKNRWVFPKHVNPLNTFLKRKNNL